MTGTQVSKFETRLGGSPSLVVMGGDSCSQGRGFESWHRILDGHKFGCKICDVCRKKPKIKDKRGRGWPFKKKLMASVPKTSF